MWQLHQFKAILCFKTNRKRDRNVFTQQLFGPHCLYNAMKANADIHFSNSLSEYLCKNFKCSKEDKTNYFHHNYILGKCEKCNALSISNDLHEQMGLSSEYHLESVPNVFRSSSNFHHFLV